MPEIENDPRLPKTVEAMLRAKAATGYDPVEIHVGIRGVNENDVMIAIAGARYSVKGNQFDLIDEDQKPVEMPTPEEGNTNSPQSEPALVQSDAGSGPAGDVEGSLTDDFFAREEALLLALGAQELVPNGTADNGDTVYNVVDVAGEVIATGTFAALEAEVKAKAEGVVDNAAQN